MSSLSDMNDECCVCHQVSREPHNPIICDKCNGAYHWKCAKPPLKELPEVRQGGASYVGRVDLPSLSPVSPRPGLREAELVLQVLVCVGRQVRRYGVLAEVGMGGFCDRSTLPCGPELMERQMREDNQADHLVALADKNRRAEEIRFP